MEFRGGFTPLGIAMKYGIDGWGEATIINQMKYRREREMK